MADTTRASKLQFFLFRFLFFNASSSSQGGFSAHFAQCSYAPGRRTPPSRQCSPGLVSTSSSLPMQEQIWRKKMASVSAYKMKQTFLSLQKSCKQRLPLICTSHTRMNPPGAPRRALWTADEFQNLTLMLEPLEKIGMITQRKDSGRRPGQRRYLAFFQFRERRRSVFARLSGRCRSQLCTFSPPFPFRDTHPTSETITHKFLLLGQFLLDFHKRPLH